MSCVAAATPTLASDDIPGATARAPTDAIGATTLEEEEATIWATGLVLPILSKATAWRVACLFCYLLSASRSRAWSA